MAIEEEFSIQIPDKDADEITSVGDAISYITKNPEGMNFFFSWNVASSLYLFLLLLRTNFIQQNK